MERTTKQFFNSWMILALILIIGLGWNLWRYYDPYGVKHHNYHQIAGIDMNQDNKVTLQSVLDGDDAVLVANQADGLHYNTLSDLDKFDVNSDHVIDHLDPLYAQLVIFHYSPGNDEHYTFTLEDFGIRAIRLKSVNDDGQYHVILSNSSTRKLMPAPKIPEHMLPK